MKFFKSKKAIVLLGAMVVAVAASIGAYAYFTTGGSGNGTGTVGVPTAFTIATTTTGGPLYPGNAATDQTIHFAVTNPGSGNQTINTISLTALQACTVAWAGDVCNGGAAGVGNIAGCETFDGSATNPGNVDFYVAPTLENQNIPGWCHARR